MSKQTSTKLSPMVLVLPVTCIESSEMRSFAPVNKIHKIKHPMKSRMALD